jgi:hypothetical protein
MKTMFLLTTILLLALTEGSTAPPAPDSSADRGPVTVHVTYRVIPGKEAEFKAMLSRAWEVYRRDDLVLAEPHILLQDTDEDSLPRFVEIFSWASRSIHEHPTTNVWAVWREMHALCEYRSGHSAIHAEKVKLVVPPAKSASPTTGTKNKSVLTVYSGA